MKKRLLHIKTIGCQMNVYDSEHMAQALCLQGFELTDLPEQADVILLNTCAIREKAVQKAYSYLGRMAELKKKKPSLIIGIGGCVAQQEGDKVFQRAPYVDLVLGTHAVHRLPEMIQRVARRKCRVVDVQMSRRITESIPETALANRAGPARFLTIMRGCDNFCAYCVVPYVRGRETSRDPRSVVAEVERLVAAGAREVTLLGQNVNSYGKKEGLCSFSKLLEKVDAVPGLLRIRFTTSHPKDISEELIQSFGRVGKLCRHIHLPVQSGSDRILSRMNRRYSRESYLDKIDALRRVCPDIAVTSDFIVGFPGETEDDFQETLDLIRQVRFDSVFAFNYSDRPNVPADGFPDKVSEAEKAHRLHRLFELQAGITKEKNQALVGSIQGVLVEGESRRQEESDSADCGRRVQWSGRTSSNRIVNFSFDANMPNSGDQFVGSLVDIHIEQAHAHSLWGNPVGGSIRTTSLKGASSYAA
jgi:tRNA-2-methylthio-N6-dimethylallyladenosine synthase